MRPGSLSSARTVWSVAVLCRRRRFVSCGDLTRARTMLTRERGREIQRLEKVLEDAGIKLSSVASDIFGVSGRLMLQALVDGQRDRAVLTDLAKRRLRAKIPALIEALTGRFSEHHAFLTRMYLG